MRHDRSPRPSKSSRPERPRRKAPEEILASNRQYHDRVAPKYDQIYENRFHRLMFELAWDVIETHLPRDLSAPVADLGCGTGLYGLRMAKTGFTVTLSDLSEKMLEQARRKADGLRATPEFVRADIGDLSGLPGDHFAFVTAMGEPVSMAADPQRALREIARLLIPNPSRTTGPGGGIAVFTVDQRLGCIDLIAEHGGLDDLEALLESGATNWLTDDPAERFPLTTWTGEEIEALCRKAGLEVLEMHARTVLPWRKLESHGVFDDEAQFRRLVKLEKKYARQRSALGRAGHLLVVAERSTQ